MRLTADDQTVLDGLSGRGDALVAQTLDWAHINTGSRNLVGLARQQDLLLAALSRLPGVVEAHPLCPSHEVAADGQVRELATTDAVSVTVRPDAPVQVILTGHYDTVFAIDSGFQSVVRRPDGALNGPGVADMKGGLCVMLAALEAFETHPLSNRVGYRVLLSPDEEVGSLSSSPLLARFGRLGHIGMTYEPALSDGTLAGARKGSGNFHVAVRGRAAHAGRDFQLGRNAIATASRLAVQLDGLNGQRDGVTLNVARIDGGAPLNMVPEAAVVRFNVRFPDADAAAWVQAAIRAAVDAAHSDGISLHLHGGVTRPAKPMNTAQTRLFEAVRDVGSLIGQPIAWKPSGGVCEGNNLFASGLPNIDTLGVRGGDIHSDAEFAWPESFAERAQLSALILMKLADGGIDGPAIRAAMETV
jgi:glutamate carboxypeptidase